MARCDTCHLARWDPECVTRVWCEKKQRYIRLDGARHLLAAVGHIQRRAAPASESRKKNSVTVRDVVKL